MAFIAAPPSGDQFDRTLKIRPLPSNIVVRDLRAEIPLSKLNA